ncbi:putative bifunctional diguanylate cyclase/phosphodiesterase [Solemya velum gill symbiont]|uniref:Diguanylate cyclase domain-containing protein n=3 Tax=Solemya velum gill symbiont TaxID=2340 RepID=A0A0B0H920_SOVGS|nr:GGDEF domain-containing phosphodiesterase [Solemya velum gill symbiont]KHF24344.1 diguanylate cyclase domain-containing protein [Solemya velum gill symbiont]OOY35226.1 hypothetical protein BOV88_05755 [Solemya velum gill symbiont]OOY37927.1 hypothetical protein BOV89_04670 [Solemya velum gill symbiont]OOY48144.1 hypothetical protein BOV92_00330 [Solemya velum gill symbiont]OOY51750.1 hypothetical protein BOV94_04380 [Solemya velum gill symbiont]
MKKLSHELPDIRSHKRFQLWKLLSSIGALLLLIFSLVNLADQNYRLGGMLLAFSLVILLIFLTYRRSDNSGRAMTSLNIIIIFFCLYLLISGGRDNTGILWIYPVLITTLSVNVFRSAAITGGTLVLISTLLLFTPLSDFITAEYSQTTATRFIVTLTLLYIISLIGLHYEQQAYRTIQAMHNQDLHKLAYYDGLTGLPNRNSFKRKLARIVPRTHSKHQYLGLLYIDLDNFHTVNDLYGHQTGDQLLVTFAESLQHTVRTRDLVAKGDGEGESESGNLARLAGDEFVVLLSDLKHPADAAAIAQRILMQFDGGFEAGGLVHPIHASIGIAVSQNESGEESTLLRDAEVAMNEAKRSGGNTFQFFTDEISQIVYRSQKIESGLSEAIESKSFHLVYMPIYDCQTLKIVGIEALLRSNHPSLEGIGPDEFIPVAESKGRIKWLDKWVLENALHELTNLQQIGFDGVLCVNMSGAELHTDKYPQIVAKTLKKHGINPKYLEIEITETALVADNVKSVDILRRLRELGITLSLDDFGTGYTAFSQLINYPVNSLKIDRSFVAGIFSQDDTRRKMVEIILNLAEIYKLRIVAEGVETREQFEYLKNIGCHYAQGYLFSKPLPVSELVTLLEYQRVSESI